jgi:hypothetical protein
MDWQTDGAEQFETDFDGQIRLDDDSEPKALLGAGGQIHTRRPDTPPDHVLLIHGRPRGDDLHTSAILLDVIVLDSDKRRQAPACRRDHSEERMSQIRRKPSSEDSDNDA